ncbi:STE20-related kinase adapter protein beta isoform X3 [Onychostruthus taczanowskii]|uniref:STE20-related kinase adapter protein beta isoform X3 n=1 Tax=Onychostruthus taczanowskii TaxID=356909 RepID=UPI001B807F67|nr:STE20-related kinase adapter protein beta isoform X3 [Onychostruthus taczanowskii]
MSCLDCSCILRTPVESIRPEELSQSSIHECLADSDLAWIPPSTGKNEMVFCSSNVSHYELQLEIGRRFNNLTSVYLARHTPTDRQVAVRITDLENCSEEHLKALQNEVVLSHFFQHPNIMTFWTVFTAGSWLWVISPFMAYGSARHLLKTYFPEGMSEALIGNILFGAIRGLNYMHQNGYIHRNIKASHILISEDGLVSLSGLNNLYSLVSNGQKAKVVYDFPPFSTSVLPWLSPELLRQMLLQKLKGPTSCHWDINTFPRGESRMKNSRSGVDSGIGESMTRTMTSERLQMPFSKTFSPAFHNLVELCLQQDPEKRPSASSLLSHTFFKQIKEQTQNSLLSLLPPPIQNNRSEFLALPSTAVGTELGRIATNQDDTDWEF